MKVGLDVFIEQPGLAKNWGRIGLLSNQASVTHNLQDAWQVFAKHCGSQLKALFGPQHGFVSTVQDNMIETKHGTHQPTGLPVYSLYADKREPTAEMLSNIDTLVVDLQVTGCRVYTYKYSMAACLRAAKQAGKRVVILDRPNPIGGVKIEGPCLKENVRSFVGEFPIPMRHGLTMGEAAKLFNETIQAQLEIVNLQDWDPSSYWHELNRHWVLPSPNVPMPECAYTFPGTVLLEGTNFSEGRGTCLPFLFVGAPYVPNAQDYAQRLMKNYGDHEGEVYFRPTSFQPSFQKWANQACNGIQIHILDPKKLRPFDLGLAIIRSAIEVAPNDFKWIAPGYEYNFELLPITMLVGDDTCPAKFRESSFDVRDPYWQRGIESYVQQVSKHLIYPRQMQW